MLIVLWSTRNIKSLFPLKDKVGHRSCVIYEKKCPCKLSCTGNSEFRWKRNSQVRWKEHEVPAGKSESAKHLIENASIVDCIFTFSYKENSESVPYCTKKACIKWLVRASFSVLVLSWYCLNVTLFNSDIFCHYSGLIMSILRFFDFLFFCVIV